MKATLGKKKDRMAITVSSVSSKLKHSRIRNYQASDSFNLPIIFLNRINPARREANGREFELEPVRDQRTKCVNRFNHFFFFLREWQLDKIYS